MIIRDLALSIDDGGFSIGATVAWEENGFPTQDIHFTVRDLTSRPVEPSANAFLAGCYPLAALHGERRVRIDGAVCPMLSEGMQTAHAWWRHWGGISGPPPAIEPFHHAAPNLAGDRESAVFISGGVDGFHALWDNHRRYTIRDPAYACKALFIEGYDISTRSRRAEPARFSCALDLLRPVLDEAGIWAIPCKTNLRDLPSKPGFWTYRHNGAALAAMAHAAMSSPGFVHIGGTYHLRYQVPIGSCPELDPLYSTQDVTLQHCGARLTRLAKIRELAAWPAAIASLRVCPGGGPAGTPNCGVCEKCLRTRLELFVAGIEQTPTLGPSLTPVELWEALPPTVGHRTFMYEELISELWRLRRRALCDVLSQRLGAYRSWSAQGHAWPAL